MTDVPEWYPGDPWFWERDATPAERERAQREADAERGKVTRHVLGFLAFCVTGLVIGVVYGTAWTWAVTR